MRVTFDRTANAAYIYLRKIGPGEVHETVNADGKQTRGMVNLDFDKKGRLSESRYSMPHGPCPKPSGTFERLSQPLTPSSKARRTSSARCRSRHPGSRRRSTAEQHQPARAA